MQLDAKISSLKILTSALVNNADTFSFVLREGEPVSHTTEDLLKALKIYMVDFKTVSEWPGTRLLWDHASLYMYHFNTESGYLLYMTEDKLFKWQQPDLPEDLVFYKENRPFFVSITHENDAYFEFEESEEAFLKYYDLV